MAKTPNINRMANASYESSGSNNALGGLSVRPVLNANPTDYHVMFVPVSETYQLVDSTPFKQDKQLSGLLIEARSEYIRMISRR